MSVISEALVELGAGDRTLDEVETLFRQHDWPPRETDPPESFNDLMEQADRDGDAAIDGTFTEVEAAYVQGVITHEQYAYLAQVVGEVVQAQREEDDS